MFVLAPVGGVLKRGRTALVVDRTNLTARSVEFDAIVVAGGTAATGDIKQTVLLQEAYRHCKALAAWAGGEDILTAAGIDLKAPGVSVGTGVDKTFTDTLTAAIGLHRAWDRADLDHGLRRRAGRVAPSVTVPVAKADGEMDAGVR